MSGALGDAAYQLLTKPRVADFDWRETATSALLGTAFTGAGLALRSTYLKAKAAWLTLRNRPGEPIYDSNAAGRGRLPGTVPSERSSSSGSETAPTARPEWSPVTDFDEDARFTPSGRFIGNERAGTAITRLVGYDLNPRGQRGVVELCQLLDRL